MSRLPDSPAGTPSAKILDLDALATRLQSLKSKGRSVVHCHGVFDLLHLGHIRHLSEAKTMGDILVVTLTPDQYVNKGPHRPAFTATLRAEVLAALSVVDFVAVNRWPTAVETIRLLQPDVYAKGPDYKASVPDITGGIKAEEEAVTSVGGKIRFTEDITFSSSSLLNRHMALFPPEVETYLKSFREKHTADEIAGHLAALRPLRVVVVGEAIIDEYVYCDAMGKSSKDAVLALRFVSRELFAGGSLAIANHTADFCDRVRLLTYLGDHSSHEEFIRSRVRPGIEWGFVRKAGSPTTLKRRYVEHYLTTKLLEVYEINDDPMRPTEEGEFCGLLEAELSRCDVVVVADFGHGLIGPRVANLLSEKAPYLAVNTQINAANMGFHTVSKYRRADYVCIKEGEIRLDHRSRNEDLRALASDLSRRLACRGVMVTRGKFGTLLFVDPGHTYECPSFALHVVDRIGAGDTVLALTALCMAAGVPPDVVAFLGNLAGAQAVSYVGHSHFLDRVALLKSVESMLK